MRAPVRAPNTPPGSPQPGAGHPRTCCWSRPRRAAGARPDPAWPDARRRRSRSSAARRDMASDLADHALSGSTVQLCGDAHLSNFGVFASPERELLFDINDFDETLPGPWEWDVKRLAASFEVPGRERGFDRGAARRGGGGRALVPRGDARASQGCAPSSLVRAARRGAHPRHVGDAVAPQERSGQEGRREGARHGSARVRRQADATRRRRAPHRRRPAADRPARGPRSRARPPRTSRSRCEPCCARTAAACRSTGGTCSRSTGYVDIARKVVGVGSVGTRALDPPASRPRRRRPAVPPGQGGAALRARALRGHERLATTGSASSPASG